MAYHGETYEARRFATAAVRRRLRVIERVVFEYLRGRTCVLDLGCGTGRFTVQIEAPCVLGLDRDRSMLAVARRRGVAAVLADGNALPFANARFDAVVATDQVFNFLDQQRALAECARVLSPGGLLVLHYNTHAVWSPRRPWKLTPRPLARSVPGHVLVRLAQDAGLEVIAVRLWRWLRVYPYLHPVPPWPWLPLWNHGVYVFRKTRAARGSPCA